MKKSTFAPLLFVVLLLGACSNQVSLGYTPPPSRVVIAGAPVEIGTVTDKRENSPNRLGAIRGGYGNPLKYLDTAIPVKDMAANAFVEGLKARGLYADGIPARYSLSLVINRLDCSQLARREAHAHFNLSLAQKASGAVVYQKDVAADVVQGDIITFDAGIIASVEDLRVVANQALQQAIDKALDDPAFVAVLK